MASSPARLPEEDIESVLDRLSANVEVIGVFVRLGVFFTWPLAVLFVPFVDAGEMILIGLVTSFPIACSLTSSGVRTRVISVFEVA